MKSHMAVLFIALLPTLATAEQFDSVQIDNHTCSLVKSGTDNHDVLFAGEAEFGKCFVTVPIATFKKTYSFCALSGVLASKGRIGCQFGYYDRTHERVAFIGNTDQVCEFVCVTHEPK